ncbi:MAG: 50S ribosomal protein L15 [Oscillospiraceae bacterium]|nr:50S ribosomal protein L15 [Oscillospiraceae bacterium]
MQLHDLTAVPGSTKAKKRVGRGHGSGQGKTAGYGHKGQKARSGAKRAGFEGGQMPLQRRVPKRGFNNIFRTEYAIINLKTLEENFEAGAVVDEQAIVDAGLLKKTLAGIKILGEGELTKPLTIKAAKCSASAKEKIEKAGGTVEVTVVEEKATEVA